MRTIDIQFKPSRYFSIALVASLSCCAMIAITLPLAFFYRLILAVVVLAYGRHIWKNWVMLRGRLSITQLRYADDSWEITDNTSTWQGKMCGDTTLTPMLAILRFKQPGVWKKRSCLVFRDTLEPDIYRRLLVATRTASLH